MAAKKKSTAQKVGKFVANELLGVDDMRRVVKYVRQGDFKKAAKSAGAAAVEVGTTAFPIGAGAKIGKVAGKVVGKAARAKDAERAGMAAARDVAEKTPRGRLGKEGGERFTKRVEPKKSTTIKDAGGKQKAGSYGGSKVEGTTPKRTMSQRIGVAKKGDTDRTKKVVEAGMATQKAVMKTSTKPKTYGRGGAVLGATAGTAPAVAKSKNKKKK